VNRRIFKALANDKRLEILEWLKNPEEHFSNKQAFLLNSSDGTISVCVGDIQEKAHLSQSTISTYLIMLQEAGLLDSERSGKWTYYRRNEKAIQSLASDIKYLL